MASWVFRCSAAWLLFGDVLLSISSPSLGESPEFATTAAERYPPVGRAHAFAAGDDAATDVLLAFMITRGRQLFLDGSLDEAAEVLEDVLASNHDEPTALMHLAEVLSHMGRPVQAVELVDRLLGQRLITAQARSFMLNRRGIYLAAAGDSTGAQQSYELALETGGQGQARMVNRHALCNLANLYHFNLFRSETTRPDFSILERAIELYRAALGQYDTSRASGEIEGIGEGVQEDDIGGEIDRLSVCRHLAAALVLAGRPSEAISHLERALSEFFTDGNMSGTENGSRKEHDSGSTCDREAAFCEQGAAASAVATTKAAATPAILEEKKNQAFLLDSLSGARSAAGDLSGAITAERTALNLVDDEPGLYHNMAVLLQKSGLLVEARDAWLSAVALDPNFSAAFAGLGHLEGAWGNVERAREFFEESLSALRSPKQGNGGRGNGTGHSHVGGQDAELVSIFLIATAVVPALYESRDHITQVRRDFESGLDRLLAEHFDASSSGVEDPSTTVGSGALGYYIIYQGFEDIEIRRKLARAYWKFVPSLRYCAPFLERDNSTPVGDHQLSEGGDGAINRRHQPRAVEGVQNLPVRGTDKGIKLSEPSPVRSTVAASIGIPTGSPTPTGGENDALRETMPKPREERNSDRHRSNPEDDHNDNTSSPTLCLRRRIRVGFLSAFFYHHSVGLLMEGVVTGLDRGRFETTAIFLQSHPVSSSDASASSTSTGTGGEESIESTGDRTGADGDGVYRAVRAGTEHVLDVPSYSLAACRHAIASLELDVLIFTEIGMNLEAYILSFARLARRSAVFWGHAVTSGVSATDAISTRNDGLRHPRGTDGGVEDGRLPDYNRLGGIDYFVSSWLFEDKTLGRRAQRKYSETLYLMKGLTTRFDRPPPPRLGIVTRQKLGIPPRPLPPSREDLVPPDAVRAFFHSARDTGSMAASAGIHRTPSSPTHSTSSSPPSPSLSQPWLSSSSSCEALYLVPQTLYKLHPDFDHLVAGVLTFDPSGCVVLIKAVEGSMTDRLARRMSGALSAAGVRPERVILVPQVELNEFSGLVALADVVLDPFPVGGGRSSFEIFSVGTPIVMLYNRTSILQLTYGMYATMGLEGVVGSAANTGSDVPVSLVTHTQDEFIRSAVVVATDAGLNARLRKQILDNNHRLYEQDEVVSEWEDFLEGIVSIPRPAPTEWRRHQERHQGGHEDLAVDASDFPAKLSWCSSSNSNTTPKASPSGVTAPAMTTENHGVGVGGVDGSNKGRGSQYRPNTSRDAERTEGTAKTPTTIAEVVEHPGSSTVSARTDPVGAETDPDGIINTRTAEAESAAAAAAFAAVAAAAAVRAKSMGGPSDEDSTFPPSPLPEAERHYAELLRGLGGVGEGFNVNVNGDVYADFDAGAIDGSLVGSGDIDRDKPLLYAIELSVAPPSEGGQPLSLLAEIYEGEHPMEEADRLREEGALDYLQYRWVGAVLCRGVRRLQRPVVWSTYVQVKGGPRALLEVHEGDDLWQIARWHCRRYSLGPERVAGLSAKLEKALPQHAGRAWLSARAEDRSCSMPVPALPSTKILLLEEPPVSIDEGGHSSAVGAETESSSTPRFSATREFHASTTKGDSEVGGDEAGGVDRDDEEDRGDGGGCVTLAITTCKRLRAFLGTAEGLQALLGRLPQGAAEGASTSSPRVCQVLVVDDGSSPADRSVMVSAFPRFTYVFKGPEDIKGHAGSVNVVLTLTKHRYLLYVEDDWWASYDSPLPPQSGVGNVLWRAMEVLTKSTEQVSQVLLNDQSTRNCAWGDTATCTAETQGTAGWARSTPASGPLPSAATQWADDPSNAAAGNDRIFRQPLEKCTMAADGVKSNCGAGVRPNRGDDADSASFNTTSSKSDNPAPKGEGRGVQYRLHEFGLLAPSHSLTHWPGFSLNPALWDLARLERSYRRRYGRKLEFDPTDIRFEQSISMELSDADVSVAYLPDVTFRHVGAGQSAYAANNMRRPWD